MYSLRHPLQPTAINRVTMCIIIIVIALPIIDTLTALTANFPLSAGIVIRMLALLLLYSWLTFVLYQDNRFQFLFLQTILVMLVIGFFINWSMKEPFWLVEEITFVAKTAYGVILLFTAIYLIQYKNIDIYALLKAIPIPALIIGITFWTAILSDTTLSSYQYEKAGYTGWFYSANELGVILIILLALAIVSYHIYQSIASFLAMVSLLSVLPMLGTKTPLYGGLLILILYSFFIFLAMIRKHMRNKGSFQPIAFGFIFVVFILTLPYTPFYENTASVNNSSNIEKSSEPPPIRQQMLSSRDIYLQETEKAFSKASTIQQLFGIGYGGLYTKAPKMVEMDGYDLLFGWGIVGLIVYVGLILFIGARIIRFSLDNCYGLLLFCLFICCGVSLIAGHILFAPSVMTYVALLILCTGLIKRTSYPNRSEVL